MSCLSPTERKGVDRELEKLKKKLQFYFIYSIIFGILYAGRGGILNVIISSTSSFVGCALCSILSAKNKDRIFHGIWEIRSTIRFTQTIVYFITILCATWMYMFPKNLTIELTADSSLFAKTSMALLIASACVGTNLAIIFVWDAIYKDYLRLADKLEGNSSKFHKKVLTVIRPELVLLSVVTVLICAVLKIVEKDEMKLFLISYSVILIIVALILISQSYVKAKVLRISSTEVIVIRCGTREVILDSTVYQVGYVLAWKDGSVLRHVSLHDVQQVEVRENERIVSVWKPKYRKNAFQWIKE